MTQLLRIAYSPDADDAFMYWALEQGLVSRPGLELELVTGDIESLNRQAASGELDVTAISFAAWPRLKERYDLLTVGSSFGIGQGPKLVSVEPMGMEDVGTTPVLVPGLNTTACLLVRLLFPGVEVEEEVFDAIPQRLLDAPERAGVVIHESQLTYEDEGLRLVKDLGVAWSELTGLPLPLGANAISRSLSSEVVADFAALLRESIELAWENKDEALASALRFGRGLDDETGERFVAAYVNELSLDAGEKGREAVAELYRRASEAGCWDEVEARWA
ncbi:MAG: MqnA/MqnD/SBP family protein [Acidobacteriota bacterium]